MTTTKHSLSFSRHLVRRREDPTEYGRRRARVFIRAGISQPDPAGKIECIRRDPGQRALRHHDQPVFVLRFSLPANFSIDLENQALGKITGNGLINDKVIAWEFRVEDIGFDGFEFYEEQPDNSYLMHAEYATSDQFRTLIQGKVWQASHF